MTRVFFLAVFLFLFSLPVSAQDFLGADPLTLQVSPQYPRPNQTVTIAPRSTLIDLAASKVRISVNGSSVYEGSGAQATTVQVGDLGQRTVVTVTVTEPSGEIHTREQVFRPAEVSLILEPDSTSHPFYQGGGLVASEGRVRLVAVSDMRTAPGTRISTSDIVYTWYLGDRLLTDASGIGKSSLVARAPVRYRNATIRVVATSRDSTLVGEASVLVSAIDPVVRIYPNDPLLGPNFDTAITNRFTMNDTEATFRAIGYFFAVPPVLSWTVNNAVSGTDKDITVRSTGSGTGSARLGITATESASRRNASAGATIEFGSNSGFGFFGI